MTEFGPEPLAIVAKYQATLPVNVIKIAHELGIRVYDVPLGKDVSGKLTRDAKNGGTSGFAIYMNYDHSPNRKRFTLAHEIAHFILHRDLIVSGITDDSMYRSSLTNVYEVQANRMAADILMPAPLIRQHREGKSVAAMAMLFEVSDTAMEIRLNSIKP